MKQQTEQDFTVKIEKAGSKLPVTIFHLEGRLDPRGADILEEQGRKAHAGGMKHLLLDFKDVNFVTSAGLRAVLTLYKLLNPTDDTSTLMRPPSGEPYKSPYLRLVNLSPSIYYIFNISGFSHNLSIYNDLEDALQAFEAK